MHSKQQKLIDILKEMFQLDQSDLDFGIYRIMNAKADEIRAFLEKDLVTSIKEAFSASGSNPFQAELDEAIASARSLGVDPETIPKVQELRAKLAGTSDTTALENDVYSHLATFFSRYYKDGDFVSLRRYKKDTYAIPYEGEEVKLHWANSDQYYIKTSEYFKDYTFKVSEKTVHFKLIDADTEANNNKASTDKERRFVIYEEKPVEEIDGELYIYFEYKAVGKEKQEKLNEKALEVVMGAEGYEEFKSLLATPAPTEKNKKRTLLEKHLKSYTSRNSFDYFIHKDLGGFLNRELDFYIKNEMLYLDDIEDATTIKIEESLSKIKTFKSIAKKIIAFLTQLEEFQKSLWLKKKFIIETNYCITLDKIDEKYYEEILANDAQLGEWVSLFDVKIESLDDLKAEPYLVLDTKFFDEDFKNKLLAEFDDLDEEIDGVLINSDNFGALNFLQERYRGQIDSTYIDPPYNTDASAILYKNNYKNSSWISLMFDRLLLSKSLLKTQGILCAAIDDEEVSELRYILSEIFDKEIGIATIRSNPAGRKTKGKFAPAHEYALFYGNSNDAVPSSLSITEKRLARYPKVDDKGNYAWANFIRSGNNDRREDRPKLFYPIFVSLENKIRIPKMQWNTNAGKYDLLEQPNIDESIVYPILEKDSGAIEKNWQRGHERVPNELEEYRVRRNNGKISIDFKTRMDENSLPITWWDKKEYASANYGAAELKAIFNEKPFDFAKSINLVMDSLKAAGASSTNAVVLDYFAGSGTTGHSVVKFNRADNGKRKYILVEMGEYFSTVVKPRIQKVIYSDNWKDGKPQDKEGISQMFKYFKLESYEDTLNNLEFKRTKAQQTAIDSNKKLKEDYLLNYMLDYESSASQLNIDNFSKPFDYKLKVSTGSAGETKETAIDLVETFNYLIGLKVKTRMFIKEFLVIEGENLKEEKILIIWREGNDNEALNSFFSKMDFSGKTKEFDTIYVNGDNNLANLKKDEDHFKVKLIEEEFKRLMFNE